MCPIARAVRRESRSGGGRSARWPERAGAALVWAALCFALLQVFLALALEFGPAGPRDPNYAFKLGRLREDVAAHPGRPLWLALGSSHTANAFRPSSLGRPTDAADSPVAFNFAVLAAGPVEQLLTLRRLLDAGIRPQWVQIEVFPALLLASDRDFFVSARPTWREIDVMQSYLSGGAAALYRRHWADFALPSFYFRFSALTWFAPGWLPLELRQDGWKDIDDDGWLKIPIAIGDSEKRSWERIALEEFAPLLRRSDVADAPARALRDSVLLCDRLGIESIVVLMPEASAFRALYSPAASTAVDRELESLRATPGLEIVDGRSWVPDDQFIDGHHVLASGAETFTRRFSREVYEPRLRVRRASARFSVGPRGSA